MKMKISLYLLAIITIATLTSCEKEIDFKYHDIPEQLVIEGLLTQKDVNVRITKTIPTDEQFNDLTVTDATVTLLNMTTGKTYSLIPGIAGVFTLEDVKGELSHEYELTVKCGESVYTSTCSMLTESEIVSAEFNWIKMPYDDVAVLKVQFTEDADKRTSYWLRVYRNGQPYQWQTISSHNAVDGIVRGLMMTSRKDITQEDDDTVLKDGDVIDIELMPVSQRMADYLNSLNNGDYNGNRMFSGEYCLGYFLAAPVATTQLIYHPEQIPYAE